MAKIVVFREVGGYKFRLNIVSDTYGFAGDAKVVIYLDILLLVEALKIWGLEVDSVPSRAAKYFLREEMVCRQILLFCNTYNSSHKF